MSRAEAGEAPRLAVLARRQSAGRGSRGRGWIDPPAGNLAVTLLLPPSARADTDGSWPFLAAVAFWDALSDGGRLAGLELKWPNDVLLGGRKLAGILVERGLGAGNRDWVAIGFGANLASAPAVAGRTTACLAELDAAPRPEVVAVRLMAAVDHWCDRRDREGFAPIRERWERLAHPRGAALVVRVGQDHVGGSFAGIAEDGALLLDTASGRRRLATGEVLAATEH